MVCLALWIMDDGFKSGNGICLSTESFTLAEVELKKKQKKNKKKGIGI